MHTDPDTIAIVSMYGVHHNFSYHVDKFEAYNSYNNTVFTRVIHSHF